MQTVQTTAGAWVAYLWLLSMYPATMAGYTEGAKVSSISGFEALTDENSASALLDTVSVEFDRTGYSAWRAFLERWRDTAFTFGLDHAGLAPADGVPLIHTSAPRFEAAMRKALSFCESFEAANPNPW